MRNSQCIFGCVWSLSKQISIDTFLLIMHVGVNGKYTVTLYGTVPGDV